MYHPYFKEISGDMFKFTYSAVAYHYKIPRCRLKREYTYSEIKEMLIDILYFNKDNK